MLVSLERVVERMGRSYHPGLIGDCYCQDANAIVVGQRQRSRTPRYVERVSKQVGICVRFGAAVGGASLRAEPSDIRALDEARAQSDHFAIRIRARSNWRAGRRPWSLRDWVLGGFPDAIVPLTDEAGPLLNC